MFDLGGDLLSGPWLAVGRIGHAQGGLGQSFKRVVIFERAGADQRADLERRSVERGLLLSRRAQAARGEVYLAIWTQALVERYSADGAADDDISAR